ncbi:hypothetical protein CTAYLR_007165 [Chrysophaeum taylorii]|uniref:Uncharacterized protein n=1 Tax=Chrysophaeum taylorii TaxID=2483200 RepID=A0AAD7UM71_9STRA|nr:hypothetical protein CTAYLR_007165 [Chrysophaeum taylorii]
MPKGARRVQDARRKELALESLHLFCVESNRKRRPRRESPDFKVVVKVMEWWIGDEWRKATMEQQDRYLRSATQWQNQRFKRSRHRLVDDDILETRVGILLQMASGGQPVAPQRAALLPHFRGSARDWASRLGLPPCDSVETCHAHTIACGHQPVKVLSTEGTTSLGFVMSRASCCAASGHLLCDVHSGNHSKIAGRQPSTNVPMMQYSTVAHGDHIDFVVDGHLTHPTSERLDDGEVKWAHCGELIELDQDTIADMYDILA